MSDEISLDRSPRGEHVSVHVRYDPDGLLRDRGRKGEGYYLVVKRELRLENGRDIGTELQRLSTTLKLDAHDAYRLQWLSSKAEDIKEEIMGRESGRGHVYHSLDQVVYVKRHEGYLSVSLDYDTVYESYILTVKTGKWLKDWKAVEDELRRLSGMLGLSQKERMPLEYLLRKEDWVREEGEQNRLCGNMSYQNPI